ncbi:MAG: hypothetical protein FJ293_15145 [Planctomycetes bacterium]|nr:hypothetical protein [Planctomycetota bacterium]
MTAHDPAAAATAAPVASTRRYSPVTVLICMVATWLLPGLGHWLLGRRGKALLYAITLSLTFLIGLVLAEFRAVRTDEDFRLYLFGEGLFGLAAFPTLWLTEGLELAADYPRLEVGRLFCTVAGIMNVCVIVDVFETAYPRAAAAPAE